MSEVIRGKALGDSSIHSSYPVSGGNNVFLSLVQGELFEINLSTKMEMFPKCIP